MNINGCEYRLVRGSDIHRDGMYLEIEEANSPSSPLAEVFYSDSDRTFTLNLYDPTVPADAVAWLEEQARALLPLEPYGDAPVPKARIFVELLDEGTVVWRPVEADHIDGDIYRIAADAMPVDEKWKFHPGDVVRCIRRTFEGAASELVAQERVNPSSGLTSG